MATKPPTPKLSDTDKRLLLLMSKLVLEHLDHERHGGNMPPDRIALADHEAEELAEKLDSLLNSPQFIEATYFIEGLTQPGHLEEKRVREIYFSARQRFGRSRVQGSAKWADFKIRLGIKTHASASDSPFLVRSHPMPMDRFEALERQLLAASGVHPKVAELAVKMIAASRSRVEGVREGAETLPHGTLARIVGGSSARRLGTHQSLQDRLISIDRITAAVLIVSDIGVLFTTRDWGVTGVLSSWAGALGAATKRRDG